MRRLLAIMALWPGLALGAIALDTTACPGGVASACPGGTQDNTTGTAIPTASFSTAGAADLVAVVGYNCQAAISTSTMGNTGTLGSWTRRAFSYLTGTFANTGMVEVWTANAASAFTGTVTNTHSSSGTCTGVMHVYPLTGGLSSFSGIGTGTLNTGDASGAMTFTVTTAASSSWMLGSVLNGNANGTLTAAANVTKDRDSPASNSTAGFVGRYTGTTGGTVTFGATLSSPYSVGAGIEVLAASSTAASPTASPNPQTYQTPQTVTLSCASPSPTIRCTTDGTIPAGASPVCTTLLLGYPGATVQAICQSSGLTDSSVAGFYFPIGSPFRKLR